MNKQTCWWVRDKIKTAVQTHGNSMVHAAWFLHNFDAFRQLDILFWACQASKFPERFLEKISRRHQTSSCFLFVHFQRTQHSPNSWFFVQVMRARRVPVCSILSVAEEFIKFICVSCPLLTLATLSAALSSAQNTKLLLLVSLQTFKWKIM